MSVGEILKYFRKKDLVNSQTAKERYFFLQNANHPDKHPEATPKQKEKFTAISAEISQEYKKVVTAFEVFGENTFAHREKPENEDGYTREPTRPQIPLSPQTKQQLSVVVDAAGELLKGIINDFVLDRFFKK